MHVYKKLKNTLAFSFKKQIISVKNHGLMVSCKDDHITNAKREYHTYLQLTDMVGLGAMC